jgi:hypothetical protein
VGSLVPEQQQLHVGDIDWGFKYLQPICAIPGGTFWNDADQVGLGNDFGGYQKTGN